MQRRWATGEVYIHPSLLSDESLRAEFNRLADLWFDILDVGNEPGRSLGKRLMEVEHEMGERGLP